MMTGTTCLVVAINALCGLTYLGGHLQTQWSVIVLLPALTGAQQIF